MEVVKHAPAERCGCASLCVVDASARPTATPAPGACKHLCTIRLSGAGCRAARLRRILQLPNVRSTAMATMTTPATTDREAARAYQSLEERILARDQVGASEVFYRLVQDGRPLPELLRETVRIHAPYTHVPYHQRLDDGVVK